MTFEIFENILSTAIYDVGDCHYYCDEKRNYCAAKASQMTRRRPQRKKIAYCSRVCLQLNTTTAKCEYISRSHPNQLKLNNNNPGKAVGGEIFNEEIYFFLIQKSKIESEKIQVSNCVVFNLHNMIYYFTGVISDLP